MKNYILPLFIALLTACQTKTPTSGLQDPLAEYLDPTLKPFYYGVASGDPLSDAVIIWTKVSPEDSLEELTVTWEMSTDERFENIEAKGNVITNAENGYTVNVDVQGLEAGTTVFLSVQAQWRLFDCWTHNDSLSRLN